MFSNKMLRFAAVTCVLVLTGPTTNAGAAPPNYSVSYDLHEDPNDPESPVKFTVILDLEFASQEGETTYWEMVGAEFYQPGDVEDRSWYDDFAAAPQELWPVVHNDPENPLPEEFSDRPVIAGVAEALGDYANLNYDFESSVYTTQAPYVGAALVSYWLQVEGEPEPEVTADDEPAEPQRAPSAQ